MNLFGVEFAAVAVALAILLGLLAVFAAMALFARNYIKVPPSTVAIFYGRKHTIVDEKGNRSTVGFRVVRGGAALRVPVLEQVEGVIFQTLEGHLRAILGTLTVEEINADRQAFAQKMTDEAAVDLKKMGVNIDILTIQQISDEQGYLDALGKKRTAEVKRDAIIGEALAQRDAMIKSAMADQEGKTKRYEADVAIAQALRDKESRQAEFDAAVLAKKAEADQA